MADENIPKQAETAPSFPKRFLGDLKSDIWKKVIVGGLVTAVGGLFLHSFDSIKQSAFDTADSTISSIVTRNLQKSDSSIAKQIRLHIIEEIGNDKSATWKKLDDHLTTLIQSSLKKNVGALIVGRFELDSAAPTNTIQIFNPPGHSGRIFVRVQNLKDGQRLWLLSKGRTVIKSPDTYEFDLDKLVQASAGSVSASGLEPEDDSQFEAKPLGKHFDNVYSIEFRLKTPAAGVTPDPSSTKKPPGKAAKAVQAVQGRGKGIASLSSAGLNLQDYAGSKPVEIQYLVLIAPPINMSLPQ